MSKLLLVMSVLLLAASGTRAGRKCENAKAYLDQNRANLTATFDLESSNTKLKTIQQAALTRIGLLDNAIKRNHEFMCGHAMQDLKEEAKYIEDNL